MRKAIERGEPREIFADRTSSICDRPWRAIPCPVSGESSRSELKHSNHFATAGKSASPDMLVDVTRLERDYFERQPDVDDQTSYQLQNQRRSVHRCASFNEAHIWPPLRPSATTGETRAQTVRSYGQDTHALRPAQCKALEVLRLTEWRQSSSRHGVTPTPVISRAVYNRDRKQNL